jgi:hypothetical protein
VEKTNIAAYAYCRNNFLFLIQKPDGPLIFPGKVFRKNRRRQNQIVQFCARTCNSGDREVFAGCNV